MNVRLIANQNPDTFLRAKKVRSRVNTNFTEYSFIHFTLESPVGLQIANLFSGINGGLDISKFHS